MEGNLLLPDGKYSTRHAWCRTEVGYVIVNKLYSVHRLCRSSNDALALASGPSLLSLEGMHLDACDLAAAVGSEVRGRVATLRVDCAANGWLSPFRRAHEQHHVRHPAVGPHWTFLIEGLGVLVPPCAVELDQLVLTGGEDAE